MKLNYNIQNPRIINGISILIITISLVWGSFFYLYKFINRFSELTVPEWTLTAYFMNYLEFGLVKRGLPGTIIHLMRQDNVIWSAILLYVVSLILLAFTLYLFYKEMRNNIVNTVDYFILLLLICFSPATFSHFWYDFGRFDLFLVLVFILSFFLFHLDKMWLSGLASFVGVLVHEIYLIAFFPVIILFYFHRGSEIGGVDIKNLFPLVIPSFLGGLFLFWFGKYEGELIELVTKLNLKSNLEWNSVDGALVWTRNLMTNFSIVFSHVKEFWIWGHIFILLAFWLLYYSIFYFIMMPYCGIYKILLAAPVPPLFLCFIGIDFARWFSISIIIMFFSILYMIYLDGVVCLKRNRRLMLVALTAGLLVGPFGVTGSVFLVDKNHQIVGFFSGLIGF